MAERNVVPRRTSRVRAPQLRRRDGLVSEDGRLSFCLARRAAGLHVERENAPVQGGRSILSLRFDDARTFVDWLQEDDAKFAYPLLWSRVMKEGLELFARLRARDDVA